MKNILSHTFTFQTPSPSEKDSILENIIYINEEDKKKHFVQYLQYSIKNDKSLELRQINIKVDRPYFLEIANTCLSNRERRRYIFSTIGKRRFGATSKHLDAYFTHPSIALDENTILAKYMNHYENVEFLAFHTETTDYSTNKYRLYIEKYQDFHIVFLDQLNNSSRKKIHKIFCVDITQDELELYNALVSSKQKVNYIFNKIGKNYFKQLEATTLSLSKKYTTLQDLALSKIIKTSSEMEKTSRINDNSSYRKLQENLHQAGRIDISLQKATMALIDNPEQETNVQALSTALQTFEEQLADINGLKDIASHLNTIKELNTSDTIPYLLAQDDHDFKDILLYTLETFASWNNFLYQEDENVKAFNLASVDVADALRYFTETCYKFKHHYKCAQPEQIVEVPLVDESTLTSAQSYFSEIELDAEVYDELQELERDIEMLNYTKNYTEEINSGLIHFFEGYTKVLNPLFEFKDLSYSLMLLAQKLSVYKLDENSGMLLLLMQGLISDLLEWKRSVLIEQTAEDIHFMDKSFYSNIAQIEMSLEPYKIPEDDGDIEFF